MQNIIKEVVKYVIGAVAGILTIFLVIYITGYLNTPSPEPPPIIKIPQNVKGKTGKIITIEAETRYSDARIIWKITNSPTEDYDTLPHEKHFHLVTPIPGNYKLYAFTVDKKTKEPVEPVCCEITVESFLPTPVPPRPPDPPTPVPPLPDVSQLAKDLRQIYLSSPDAEALNEYILLYKVSSEKLVYDPSVTDIDTLLRIMRKTVEKYDSRLLPIRQKIREYLNNILPREPGTVTLTTELRNKFSSEFKKVHEALEYCRKS